MAGLLWILLTGFMYYDPGKLTLWFESISHVRGRLGCAAACSLWRAGLPSLIFTKVQLSRRQFRKPQAALSMPSPKTS